MSNVIKNENSGNYGLIGLSLSHSYSKIIHEKLQKYSYDLYSLSEDEMKTFINSKDFRGLNITIPYKETVIPLCDEISEHARRIGAVNTIVNKNNKLYGYNTDYYGLTYLIDQAGISIAHKKVMILGSGGTCKTALSVVKDKGAKNILVVSRNVKDPNDENVKCITYDQVENYPDTDVIINTTPVGMYPNCGKRVIDLSLFDDLCGVVDVIFNPLRTPLILDALHIGAKASGGLPMLVAQAIYASDLFLKGEINLSCSDINNERNKLILKIITEIEEEILNVVLIGMPGSGKSVIAKELARLINKPLVDTDEEIVKLCGMSIPEIFEKHGEAYFRSLEAEVCQNLGKERGKIISTGGGAIIKKNNYDALAQNALVIHIKRDYESLATDNRPLSKDKDKLLELYQYRLPIYMSHSDVCVQNNRTIKEAAIEISKIIKA